MISIEEYAAKIAAAAPPLTAEQIERAARILATVEPATARSAA